MERLVSESNRISLNEIEGKEVILTDFHFEPSKFHENAEAAVLQLEVDGELKVVRTEAIVVVEVCRRAKKTDLPAPVIFRKVTSSKGRTYWMVE